MQVMVWLSHLAELALITLDNIENLAEFCRTVLERKGNRPVLRDVLLTWLAGARMPECPSSASTAYKSSR